MINVHAAMQSIAIRETSDGQIIVAGAKDEPAESQQEAIRLLEIGSLSRATGNALGFRRKLLALTSSHSAHCGWVTVCIFSGMVCSLPGVFAFTLLGFTGTFC